MGNALSVSSLRSLTAPPVGEPWPLDNRASRCYDIGNMFEKEADPHMRK